MGDRLTQLQDAVDQVNSESMWEKKISLIHFTAGHTVRGMSSLCQQAT
jgi:hypothetical protein